MKKLMMAVITLGCFLAVVGPAKATVYDIGNDYSAIQNPNGVWSYGYETALGSPLVLYTLHPDPNGWNSPIPNGFDVPRIGYNPTAFPILGGTVIAPPFTAAAHPGQDGQYSVFRFTTPVSGEYKLDASFFGIDFVGPTSTDDHVLKNDSLLYSGNVNGYGPGSTVGFSTILTLSAGDRIDFAVGYGVDGNYNCDSTGVTGTLTSFSHGVPDGGTTATLLGLAIAGLAAVRRKLS